VASYVLVYQSHRVVLPDGVIFVGRGIECHVRFNAPTVSRRHLRLELTGGVLLAENLSVTTGTLLNGKPLGAASRLRHGDRLMLGPRELQVEHLAEGSRDDHRAAPSGPRGGGAGPRDPRDDLDHGGRGRDPDDETIDDSDIDDGDIDDVTRPGDVSAMAPIPIGVPPQIPFHTCPECRAKVDFDSSVCPSCGHTWDAGGASALTQRTTQRAITAPASTPLSADVPVIYASDEMTIDAVAREIRVDGLFVPTELLDPEGTVCEITLLADGESAMVVRGVVTRVRAETGPSAPAGLEIRFTDVGPTARAWLTTRVRSR
jgi:predicted component of type VI protein secretion system